MCLPPLIFLTLSAVLCKNPRLSRPPIPSWNSAHVSALSREGLQLPDLGPGHLGPLPGRLDFQEVLPGGNRPVHVLFVMLEHHAEIKPAVLVGGVQPGGFPEFPYCAVIIVDGPVHDAEIGMDVGVFRIDCKGPQVRVDCLRVLVSVEIKVAKGDRGLGGLGRVADGGFQPARLIGVHGAGNGFGAHARRLPRCMLTGIELDADDGTHQETCDKGGDKKDDHILFLHAFTLSVLRSDFKRGRGNVFDSRPRTLLYSVVSFIADLHIHSRYSRATSPLMAPEVLWKWAQLKGVTVVGTGDFTHPAWRSELEEKLVPAGNGLFQLKEEHRGGGVPDSCKAEVFFLLSAEISCIYRKEGRTRKVHCLIFAPDMRVAARLGLALSKIGSVASDGRPILGLDAEVLLGMLLDTEPSAMLVPAHVWTPHFSVFGAASGFDSLEECFGELTPHIHALETGLSSDPPMNRRVSALDRLALLSNSDAHSPAKIGREATVFGTEVSYQGITGAIRTGRGLLGTIEFFPEEGKYHYDGHRQCGVCCSPEETVARKYLCPVCGRKLTTGVAHRVELLADRHQGSGRATAPTFWSAVPLAEVLSEVMGVGTASKTVQEAYMRLLASLGNELSVLLKTPPADIAAAAPPLVAEAIGRVRQGLVHVSPGYDGRYGCVKIF